MSKIYLIWSGEYSDRHVHYYTDNLKDAEKYIAHKNNIFHDDYYIEECEKLGSIPKVKVLKEHEVVFNYQFILTEMYDEPDRYTVYSGQVRKTSISISCSGIFVVKTTTNDRKKAEKIGQDLFNKFLYLKEELGSRKALEELGI